MIDEESDDELPQHVADDITADGSKCRRIAGRQTPRWWSKHQAARMPGVREPVYLSERLPLTSLRLTSRTISSIW
jgi:hypothetical protein